MRLIDANALNSVEKEIICGRTRSPYTKDYTAILRVFEVDEIRNAPTVDAVPVNELLKLRDWLYESDGITMGGLRSLNELIAKYSSDQLPKIENGFERRNDG